MNDESFNGFAQITCNILQRGYELKLNNINITRAKMKSNVYNRQKKMADAEFE